MKKNSEYYQTFKNKNDKKIKEVIKCDCGGRYVYFNKSRHMKSKKHCNYLLDKPSNSDEEMKKILDDVRMKRIELLRRKIENYSKELNILLTA